MNFLQKEIFHLVNIASNNYVQDINNIIKKMINKPVRLLYSGSREKSEKKVLHKPKLMNVCMVSVPNM